MNPLSASFKETFSNIKKNKSNFILLLFLQGIYYILLGLILYFTIIPATQKISEAMEYTQSLNVDDETLAENIIGQKNLLGDDPLLMARNFEAVKRYMVQFFIFATLLYLILNGIVWYFTAKLARKIAFADYLINFSVATIIYFIIIYLLIVPLVSIQEVDLMKLIPAILLFMIISYFYFIGLALNGLVSLKELAKKTFLIGIKKAHWILLTYFINILIVFILFLLLFFAAEKNAVFSYVFSLVFILVFVLKRMYFVNVIENIK